MLRRIVVALDDSEESARALNVACQLARDSDASVTVLHVRDKEISCCGEPWETPMVCTPDELVARAVNGRRSAGVDASAPIVQSAGRPALALLDVAADQEAERVNAGWHPHHNGGGLHETTTGRT